MYLAFALCFADLMLDCTFGGAAVVFLAGDGLGEREGGWRFGMREMGLGF